MRSDKRVSVTEVAVWRECRWRHEQHYEQRLQLIPDPERDTNYLASGSAIHFGIAYGLHQGKGDPVGAAVNAARAYLESHVGETARLLPGVERAIEGVPQEVWDTVSPQTEGELVQEYWRWEVDTDISNSVTIVGVPDLWYWKEGEGIFITDYKSTSKDEQDRLEKYELWNMQLPFYGVLVTDYWAAKLDLYPPIYLRHLVLSTRGKHAVGSYKLLTTARTKQAREMMVGAAFEIVGAREQSFLDAAPSFGCSFCDYERLCTAHITGADVAGVRKESYRLRERR